MQAHSYAPRLDAHRRRRPGKLAIARRPIQPRPRLRSTTSVYQVGVLLAPPRTPAPARARARAIAFDAGSVGGGGGGGHAYDMDGVRARPRLAHLVRLLPLGRVVAHRAAVRLGYPRLRAARALSGGMAAEPLQPADLRTAATADAASEPPARAGWCGRGPLRSRPRVDGCCPLSKAKAHPRFGQDGAAQASPLSEHASGRPKLPSASAAPLLVLP